MSKPTILVLDDEIPRIEILQKKLGEDFKVFFTDDLEKALEILQKNNIKLLLTEITFPDFDTWLAKVALFNIPVYIVTESSDNVILNKLKQSALVQACFLKKYNNIDYIVKKIKEKIKT